MSSPGPKPSPDPFFCGLPPDPRLVAEGWERRFIADDRMARDAVETYGQLGYEVRLEPFDLGALGEECAGCRDLLKRFKMVYVRKQAQ